MGKNVYKRLQNMKKICKIICINIETMINPMQISYTIIYTNTFMYYFLLKHNNVK